MQNHWRHRRRQLILIASAFNAQSLVAHAGDNESDNILMNSDDMVISETWMNCANTVMINGFELRASNNTALKHRTHCPSTSSELPVRVSAAGGSAIYRNLQSSTNCSEIIVNANKSCGNSVLRKHNVGDICLVDVKVEDLTLFILVKLKSLKMSSKIKRKVTVENSKDDSDQPRRPSVFERLGPGAVNIAAQPTDRHSRSEHNEKCRNWLRTGNCAYGNTCRYKHESFSSSSRRSTKSEKEVESKDLRHKVKTKRDEPKESRDSSLSPKRKSSKRSISRSRKGEHESKIKSTVVVTRPRSPSSAATETAETKKKPEGNWEDDSDDWPMDAAQLDYKEELTLERKRQQLQRELELELQKERLLNESVTITKTVSFSESSSTSSSSESGTISSSSETTSSSSDEDSNDSSSTSSSSSSSSSRPPTKKKNKKSYSKDLSRSLKSKGKDDYDKIKSSRAAKAKKNRSPSPILESRKGRKGRDKHNLSPTSPRKRHLDGASDSVGRSNLNVRLRGPRTPSPSSKPRKQRQWAQSSSADSRTAEVQRNKGKRHKKKKEFPRNEKRKSDRTLSPPPLSSPNRQTMMPVISSKKIKPREEVPGKTRHRTRDVSPQIMPRNSGSSSQSMKLMGTSRYLSDEKPVEKLRGDERSKYYSRKEEDELLPPNKRNDSHERGYKRSKLSPRKDSRRGSLSPHKDRYDSDMLSVGNRKLYPHEKEKLDRRRPSVSPVRSDRRKINPEVEKKRDIREMSPREHPESRRDNAYRGNDPHSYDKRSSEPKKRFVSPDMKKNRDDKVRDHIKDRNSEYDSSSWQGDHRKPGSSSTGRRTPETRGRQEMHSQPSLVRNDRSRERDVDRKKIVKKRDLSVRSVESDRSRLPSPRRSLRLRGLSPKFGLLKENSRKRTKMTTEQEAKPAVVTPSLQQWRSPSTFRGAPGEDPLKWLKEYDRVANFNKWDDMMCLANVYFFLDGTARQWYVNNEDALDSWEAFKNGLSGLFVTVKNYQKGRRTTKMLSPAFRREYTVLHTKCIRTLPRGKSSDERRRKKVSHLMKGVAEDIYQALLTREINDTASFIKWCNYIEDMKQKRVEEVHRIVNQTQESLDSDPQSLEEIVQDEVERVLAPVSTKPTETRPRPTYAAVTRKYRAPVQKFPPEPRKTDVWRTADNRPVCFHCGRPGHVMRYCRERKAVFDNSRNRRRNFDDVGTEEEIRRPNSSRRFTPSPTRGRSPIRDLQIPVAISPIQSVARP
ncbi:zinc finger CCCH domain-containing protein 13 [Trichonephila clavipes]|nr:zinc finger CCCH domain-containing protein 13 [Trichonephila clavipes]